MLKLWSSCLYGGSRVGALLLHRVVFFEELGEHFLGELAPELGEVETGRHVVHRRVHPLCRQSGYSENGIEHNVDL